MSKWWNNLAHAILKELRNKHGLTWLWMSMSYHKFSNLWEIFQGDLNWKLMDGIISCDFINRPWLQLQLCIKNRQEMCLQWGVQNNVCGIQGDMQDMWQVLYWTNTTKN
jgi:hypothetical protein